jgi:hypothetical protein
MDTLNCRRAHEIPERDLPGESPQEHDAQSHNARPAHAERLGASDKGVLLLWLLAALLGAGVAYRYFFQAFPEAALEFRVTRDQALERARAFAASQGATLDGYRSAIVFGVDDNDKTYLERELGLDQANRLMSSDINVWYWSVRFFKPLEQEEFSVFVDPAGRIVGYEHIVEEAAPGARLERAEAQQHAAAFLRQDLQVPLEAYSFLAEEASSTVRPNRTDWSFTWERTAFRAGEAPYRLNVSLIGERPGSYSEFLQVPEAWQRNYDRMRSTNNLVAAGAMIFYALLVGAALSVAFALGRRGLVSWSAGLRFGGFIAALFFVMQLNQWPLLLAGYDTNGSFASFTFDQITEALGASLLLALVLVIALVPGEPLYRASQPDHLRLNTYFRLPALRTKEFFCAGFIGICMAAAHIGYVVLFYIAGRRFGVWAPQDLQYSDTLSTALPWVYPLTIGIYASASEEFLFRLFAVPWLHRLTHSKLIAVVAPALAWGFLHANYPQEPAYIRGIEVGLIGIVAGWVMLRWGILATLVWHYTVDAFLIGLSLMRSADFYTQASGYLVGLAAFFPVAIAGLLYLRRGGFAPADSLLNRAQPLAERVAPEPHSAAPAPVAGYTALSFRAIGLFAACALAAVVLLWAVRSPRIGDFVEFPLSAAQAEARAAGVLRDRGLDPASYHSATIVQYRFDPLVNEYFRRAIGAEAANRVYQDHAPAVFWTVRYFRDSETEEYLVVLRPDGALHSFHHTLAEETAGANLTQNEALELAEAQLLQAKMLDLSQWDLIDSISDKRPARTDHLFRWEQKSPVAMLGGSEGARVRMEMRVQGDEPSGYRVFVHLPEEWVRRQNESTLVTTAHTGGFLALAGAFITTVVVIFLRNLKQPSVAAIPWPMLAKLSLPAAIAFVLMVVTRAPQYLGTYPTELSLGVFFGMTAISLVLVSAVVYCSIFALLGFAWFFLARAYGGEQLPIRRSMPATYYRDALFVGVFGCVVLIGLEHVRELVARMWPVARHSFMASAPELVDAVLPALQAFSAAVVRSYVAVGVLALVAGVFSLYLRRFSLQVLALGLVAVFVAPRWGSAGDLVQSIVVGWAGLLILWWGVRRVVRFNLLGYFLLTALASLGAASAELLGQPNSYYRAHGWAVVAVALLLLVWPVSAWLRRGSPTSLASGPTAPSV